MYEGELIRLRAFDPESDAQHYLGWVNDREAMRYMAPRYPRNRQQVQQRLEEWSNLTFDKAMFAIETKDARRLLGLAALRGALPEIRDAEVDLFLGDRTTWGKGYGTDAMRVLCAVGFDQMALHRIHLYVFADNEAARAVYRKVGFVEEARVREHFWRDGRYHDSVLMGLLRDELVRA